MAMDLKGKGWKDVKETVDFILKVNNFFDDLNGAHSEHGKRTGNDRLNPYRSTSDWRFDELKEFLQYLQDWKLEVHGIPGLKAKDRERLFLPHQTVEGIEITVRGVSEAVKYMFSIGHEGMYINARVFFQDPLEQYFSKQRSKSGSINNPNSDQFLMNDNMISIHRNLNVNRRSGNTEATSSEMDICDEPLPKRKRKCRKFRNTVGCNLVL